MRQRRRVLIVGDEELHRRRGHPRRWQNMGVQRLGARSGRQVVAYWRLRFMKINVTLPFDNIEKPQEFLTPEAVKQVGSVLERAGFNGGNVTDHPCPTG